MSQVFDLRVQLNAAKLEVSHHKLQTQSLQESEKRLLRERDSLEYQLAVQSQDLTLLEVG